LGDGRKNLNGRAKLLKDIARTPSPKPPFYLEIMDVESLVKGFAGLSTT
jgi:hypothetical protein